MLSADDSQDAIGGGTRHKLRQIRVGTQVGGHSRQLFHDRLLVVKRDGRHKCAHDSIARLSKADEFSEISALNGDVTKDSTSICSRIRKAAGIEGGTSRR